MAPSVIHDWVYRMRVLDDNYKLSRKECDDIFLDAMEDSGVGILRRLLIYLYCRAWGWITWKKIRDHRGN
jgi:hypothetical protein